LICSEKNNTDIFSQCKFLVLQHTKTHKCFHSFRAALKVRPTGRMDNIRAVEKRTTEEQIKWEGELKPTRQQKLI